MVGLCAGEGPRAAPSWSARRVVRRHVRRRMSRRAPGIMTGGSGGNPGAETRSGRRRADSHGAATLGNPQGTQMSNSIHSLQGVPSMIRISSLLIVLVLSLIIPASGQESQPSKTPSEQAQPKAECKSKCEAQYSDYKECQEGVAPMHSPCEVFNQCVRNCD
jgi:hypothetical protein